MASNNLIGPVDLDAGSSSLTVPQGETISDGAYGVVAKTAAGTVTNAGSILAITDGIQFQNGGAVANQASGVISGTSSGVRVTAGTATITNDGSISGPGKSASRLFLEWSRTQAWSSRRATTESAC
jgi:hypothetical protein